MRCSSGPHAAAVALAGLAAVIAGCTLERIDGRMTVKPPVAEAPSTVSVAAGWRVFQARCAACHGTAALGTDRGPDLLPRVAGMGLSRFTGIVLRRYDWSMPLSDAGDQTLALAALAEAMEQREQRSPQMPRWQGMPDVDASIADIHAYLSARADGRLGLGRPGP